MASYASQDRPISPPGSPPGTAPQGVTPRLPGTEQLGPNRIQCAGTSHSKVGNILQQATFGPGRRNVLGGMVLKSLIPGGTEFKTAGLNCITAL